MTSEEIENGKKLIAEFVAIKNADGSFYLNEKGNYPIGTLHFSHPIVNYILPNSGYGYWDSSWDWLMPALQKFDRLYQYEKFEHFGTYQSYCDEIDDAVTLYEIQPAFEALVSAITWYNNRHEYVHKSTFPPTTLAINKEIIEEFFKDY
jgi:hypothetical protein